MVLRLLRLTSIHQCMEKTRRLQKSDWLKAGIEALGQKGSSALKADVLAKKLGVSRGSFYWHFKDLSGYHAALLNEWEASAVDRPYAFSVSLGGADVATVLDYLVEQAFTAPIALESAVFSWAKDLPDAARSVERVNQKRFRLLSQLMTDLGFDQEAAGLRAYLLLSAYLGRMHLESIHPVPREGRGALVSLLARLEAPDGQ